MPLAAPTITTQPSNQTVFATQNASFSAAASGFFPPTVQWQVSTDGGSTFAPVPGATSDTLTVANATLSENGNEYEAVFTNGSGSAMSNPATLTVNPPTPPVVTTQPSNQTDIPGEVASFTSGASGFPVPTVVWQVSTDSGVTWSNIQGNGTSTSTTLSGVIYGTFENGWEVRAVFTNIVSSATSNPATLTVNPPTPPVVTTQPSNQTDIPGENASFTSSASGNPLPTVVWQVSTDSGVTWSNIQGNGTSTSTTLSGVVFGTFENGWEVRAVFTNSAGSAMSNPATLFVP